MAVLELEGLTKDYGEVLANDDLTFTVDDGEIFGYLGPNGAGKTTTVRILLGFQKPTSGNARVLGVNVTDRRALVEGTDYEMVGRVAPMRYYSPNEILLESSYDLVGLAVLVGITVVLVGMSQFVFTRKDI